MALPSWFFGVLPSLVGLGTLYLTFRVLLEVGYDRPGAVCTSTPDATGDEDCTPPAPLGWPAALLLLAAYQTGLALSYSGILSLLVYTAPGWFLPNEYDQAFIVTSAVAVAYAVAGESKDWLSFNLIRGPWRLPLEVLLLVPWWFFPGPPISDSLLARLLGRPTMRRAEEYWILVGAIILWRGARAFFLRLRAEKNRRPTDG